MTKRHVTRKDAEKVLQIVKEIWGVYLDDDHPEWGPQILTDYQGYEFAIVWEEGPFEWAFGFDPTNPQYDEEGSALMGRKVERPAAKTAMPKGVAIEHYYSFDICLYVD